VEFQNILDKFKTHEALNRFLDEKPKIAHWAGVAGSQLAFLLAQLSLHSNKPLLVLVSDREKALYLLDDLTKILPQHPVLWFPSSAKRPYQIEQIDNANVLRRTEVLYALNHIEEAKIPIVISIPEALYDKVIAQKSMVQRTFDLKIGDSPGMTFMEELFEEYGFEWNEFVYEPGQYTVRGGIIDFFSYSNKNPYRIEFEGDTIQSLRTFDAESQLTISEKEHISLLPNIQQQIEGEQRVQLLEFMGPETLVISDDFEGVEKELDILFEKAESQFHDLQKRSGGGSPHSKPEHLYLTGQDFLKELNQHSIIEIGIKKNYSNAQLFHFHGLEQPGFNKEFKLVSEHLEEFCQNQIEVSIVAEEKQIKRLSHIFQEINPNVHFEGIFGGLSAGFYDKSLQIAIYTDHQIFERYYRYRLDPHFDKSRTIQLKDLQQLVPGDYVTHANFGICMYAGLEKIKNGEIEKEVVKLVFRNNDIVHLNINNLHKISKYSGKDGTAPQLSKLGSNEWTKTRAKVKSRVKELAFDLVQLYAKRKSAKGFAFSADSFLQEELEASFFYEDTPDQEKVTADVKKDMESPHPMDRLVCGDVGFGKTEIAIRAAFKAACDGKQVAILVPTTVLALQHFKTFSERLKQFPVNIEYISRFKTAKEQKEIIQNLQDGKIDILIGTHRILSEDLKFKDLGLFIVDEEQRFGVSAKEKLKLKKLNVDTLTLTATPIPRTLQFSLLGVRDMSAITTPPPNRQPVETRVLKHEKEIIRDAVAYELARGGQVFFIHNRIDDLEWIAALIKELVPDARVAIAHGRLKDDQMEHIMMGFIEKNYDVLVATTIIESGLDIPNANTIIINEAQSYGLSDLHQMRGRVGRSNRKAFCYLLVQSFYGLNSDTLKRLEAIEQLSDLGSGLLVSMRDMDIRGAGDILGKEQSGFITEIGYDTYHQILDEAIYELKEEHFAEIFGTELAERKNKLVYDCQVDSEEQSFIPDSYIPNIAERLQIYHRISDCQSEQDLRNLGRELVDRFGLIPASVLSLFDAIRLREAARNCGLEKIILKGNKLKAWFISNQQSVFYQSQTFSHLITYVAQQQEFRMIKVDEQIMLECEGVKSLKQAYFKLTQIVNFVQETETVK